MSPRTIDDVTLRGQAPSHTAGGVKAFTPPGPKRVLDAQDYNVTDITEGANEGKRLLTHKTTGKREGLFKPQSGEVEIMGSNVGIEAGERYRRAPAAAYLARKAGIATPDAEIVVWKENGKEEVGSLQEWITEGTDAGRVYRRQPEVYKTINKSQPKLDLDAFDFVIANMDRNPGNWRVVLDPQTNTVQKVIAIDMDTSLPPGPERYSYGGPRPPHQPELPPTISRELYENLQDMHKNRKTIERELTTLQQVEIDGVFTRLELLLQSVQAGHITVVP
jgi:hypothetical protein